MKAFEYDSGIMKYATLLSRITLLNLAWIVFCIPVITIGASTAAQHYSVRRLISGDIHVLRNFKNGVKLFWKKGTLAWFFTIILSAPFVFMYGPLTENELPYSHVFQITSAVTLISLVFVLIWTYPLISGFSGKFSGILFNAFIFAFMYAPVTLIAVILYGAAGFLFMRFPATRILIFLFGPTLIVYCTMILFEKILQKYKNKG